MKENTFQLSLPYLQHKFSRVPRYVNVILGCLIDGAEENEKVDFFCAAVSYQYEASENILQELEK